MRCKNNTCIIFLIISILLGILSGILFFYGVIPGISTFVTLSFVFALVTSFALTVLFVCNKSSKTICRYGVCAILGSSITLLLSIVTSILATGIILFTILVSLLIASTFFTFLIFYSLLYCLVKETCKCIDICH